MSRRRSHHIPELCKHKSSDQWYVRLSGRTFYLGKRKADARPEYDRLIQAWLDNGRRLPPDEDPDVPDDLAVVELIDRFWEWARDYYVKDGEPTGEQAALAVGLRRLKALYGDTPAAQFGPRRLIKVRDRLIADGLARKSINGHVGRIKRVFKWAAERELIPATVAGALTTVKGLSKGRSKAKEKPPVRPVADAHIEAVRARVSRQVRAMIDVQLLTGMRPGEVVRMRPCDLETGGDVWLYRPHRHKGQHREQERVIDVGPAAQRVIEPFLADGALGRYLFSPREAEQERNARRRAERTNPRWPSHDPARRRDRRGQKPRQYGDRYTTLTYRQCIKRAVTAANREIRERITREGKAAGRTAEEIQRSIDAALIDDWTPHRLRHTFGTKVRKQFGAEAARVALGHKHLSTTEIYAEPNRDLAAKVAREVG